MLFFLGNAVAPYMIQLGAIPLSDRGSKKLFATLTRSRASLHTSPFFSPHSPRFLLATVKEVNSQISISDDFNGPSS